MPKLTVLVVGSDDAVEEWLPEAKLAEQNGRFVRVTHELDVKASPRAVEVVLLKGWMDARPQAVDAVMKMAGRRLRLLSQHMAKELQVSQRRVAQLLDDEFRRWKNTAAATEAARLLLVEQPAKADEG